MTYVRVMLLVCFGIVDVIRIGDHRIGNIALMTFVPTMMFKGYIIPRQIVTPFCEYMAM